METKSATFILGDEKKHSVVYREDTAAPQIASGIYFSKKLVGESNFPKKLRVTVEEIEE